MCRRSSRIQDNELRDLAQKIRQENQLKERLESVSQLAVGGTSVCCEGSKLVSTTDFCCYNFYQDLIIRGQRQMQGNLVMYSRVFYFDY
jgi:hypothetical protein